MGANRTTFEKLQRDRAKKAKAAAKRDKRMGKAPAVAPKAPPTTPLGASDVIESLPDDQEIPADTLLEMVAAVHADYDSGRIDLDEFEERKADLMARVKVD